MQCYDYIVFNRVEVSGSCTTIEVLCWMFWCLAWQANHFNAAVVQASRQTFLLLLLFSKSPCYCCLQTRGGTWLSTVSLQHLQLQTKLHTVYWKQHMKFNVVMLKKYFKKKSEKAHINPITNIIICKLTVISFDVHQFDVLTISISKNWNWITKFVLSSSQVKSTIQQSIQK